MQLHTSTLTFCWRYHLSGVRAMGRFAGAFRAGLGLWAGLDALALHGLSCLNYYASNNASLVIVGVCL